MKNEVYKKLLNLVLIYHKNSAYSIDLFENAFRNILDSFVV
jgi:hypothetical protein